MQITGTHFHYFHSCHRQLWLFANNIQMEHTNDNVTAGKQIHETSYKQRAAKYQEVQIDGIKIDYFDKKSKIIHEVKKSSKLHNAHIWQLKYYIYVLEQNGIKGVSGILEYPKERKTEEVMLSKPDIDRIEEIKSEITEIINSENVPDVINKPRCENCSYYDFCYSGEV